MQSDVLQYEPVCNHENVFNSGFQWLGSWMPSIYLFLIDLQNGFYSHLKLGNTRIKSFEHDPSALNLVPIPGPGLKLSSFLASRKRVFPSCTRRCVIHSAWLSRHVITTPTWWRQPMFKLQLNDRYWTPVSISQARSRGLRPWLSISEHWSSSVLHFGQCPHTLPAPSSCSHPNILPKSLTLGASFLDRFALFIGKTGIWLDVCEEVPRPSRPSWDSARAWIGPGKKYFM